MLEGEIGEGGEEFSIFDLLFNIVSDKTLLAEVAATCIIPPVAAPRLTIANFCKGEPLAILAAAAADPPIEAPSPKLVAPLLIPLAISCPASRLKFNIPVKFPLILNSLLDLLDIVFKLLPIESESIISVIDLSLIHSITFKLKKFK